MSTRTHPKNELRPLGPIPSYLSSILFHSLPINNSIQQTKRQISPVNQTNWMPTLLPLLPYARPRRNSLPAPFSPISSLPSNIGPPPSPQHYLTGWMAPMASLQVSKVKCKFSEPTETRGPRVWCDPTIKAYGYAHPIARAPTEDMDSGVSSKGIAKFRLL
ncbi:hypothetical protein PPACK8108_LOCUS21296 [Phakopsora pachyrhizi]|uniref:Uncharacterized protein n=1 Tax=Phakopsora pachyrhizi TaxID=170000 RepID=A0AAV0BH44_PHAPC|nr:hypothetical protein PPACK8108_LOCUS21296 [Phakopsora pachyrhizi]